MLRATIGDDARFEVFDCELRKGGVSYTIDTVRQLRVQFPDDTLYWIIGADQPERLHFWSEIGELVKLVEFIVLARPGYTQTERTDIPGLRMHQCEGHLLGISSTELRERVRQRLPVDFFMPHKTIEYIRKTGLYR